MVRPNRKYLKYPVLTKRSDSFGPTYPHTFAHDEHGCWNRPGWAPVDLLAATNVYKSPLFKALHLWNNFHLFLTTFVFNIVGVNDYKTFKVNQTSMTGIVRSFCSFYSSASVSVSSASWQKEFEPHAEPIIYITVVRRKIQRARSVINCWHNSNWVLFNGHWLFLNVPFPRKVLHAVIDHAIKTSSPLMQSYLREV